MSEIQGGRWDRFLRRMFSVKGTSVAPAIAGELVPIVTLIPERPEDALLRGDKLYWGKQSSTSAAGNYGYVQLHNASDNMLVIIQYWGVYDNAAARNFSVRLGNVATGTGNVTIAGRDTRLGLALTGKQQAGAIRFGHAAAVTGTEVVELYVPATTMLYIPTPMVLAPGHTLTVWNNAANITNNHSIGWREREAEPGELDLV